MPSGAVTSSKPLRPDLHAAIRGHPRRLALFGSSLAYWLWSDILRMIELGRANAFAYLVPIFGLAMGAAFSDESLGWFDVAGILVTLGGIALTMCAD